MRIHAICLALNEESFIEETLKPLYPHCSAISILSQYDRDWYGNMLKPDATAERVLNYPDPAGKIQLVVRRWRDEAAARNHEMLAANRRCIKGIMPHGVSMTDIENFHQDPDYFLIVDADEIYDSETIGNIIDFLSIKKPRGMRVLGYNYVHTWNRRVLPETVRFRHFGFVRPGVLFKMRRTVSWNESRLSKLLSILRLPDISSRLYNFIDCPIEVGVFHHGCWLGEASRLSKKFEVSSHRFDKRKFEIADVDRIATIRIPTDELPRNIHEGIWPSNFFDPKQ